MLEKMIERFFLCLEKIEIILEKESQELGISVDELVVRIVEGKAEMPKLSE